MENKRDEADNIAKLRRRIKSRLRRNAPIKLTERLEQYIRRNMNLLFEKLNTNRGPNENE